jgi:L-threonylcarbamoyladenylate synthase
MIADGRGQNFSSMTDADDQIARAVDVLRRGGLVAFPTETVYGLGADAANPDAVRHLFAVKGRPADHPVIVHLADAAQLDEWSASVPPAARALADAFWPGPLTVIVPRSARVPNAVTGGRDTVGLRVPGQPLAHALLVQFGGGIAAPSANRFGRVSPTTAADVRADLDGDVDLVLDGGPCRVGVESTIVDCTLADPVIARLGGVTQDAIERVIGRPVRVSDRGEVSASGTLEHHYAPNARVHIVHDGEVGARAISLLASGARVALLAMQPPDGLPQGLIVLDSPSDADDYAHVLYARLRESDARDVDHVLVVPPPADGIGAAVVDRLARAAS